MYLNLIDCKQLTDWHKFRTRILQWLKWIFARERNWHDRSNDRTAGLKGTIKRSIHKEIV